MQFLIGGIHMDGSGVATQSIVDAKCFLSSKKMIIVNIEDLRDAITAHQFRIAGLATHIPVVGAFDIPNFYAWSGNHCCHRLASWKSNKVHENSFQIVNIRETS